MEVLSAGMEAHFPSTSESVFLHPWFVHTCSRSIQIRGRAVTEQHLCAFPIRHTVVKLEPLAKHHSWN